VQLVLITSVRQSDVMCEQGYVSKCEKVQGDVRYGRDGKEMREK
jgi:hypothetical protein